MLNTRTGPVPVVGLTGTFGSGKSTVSDILAGFGAEVIDADALAREATAPGSPALDEIARRMGSEFLTDRGELDRRRTARAVFSDPALLNTLNAIVHPRVGEAMRRRMEEIAAAGNPPPAVVLNVPLLHEAGMTKMVDRVVVVVVSESERFRRLRLRDGLGEREIVRRLGAQWPQRRKAAQADYVVDNSGDPADTRRRTEAFWRTLFESGSPHAPDETTH